MLAGRIGGNQQTPKPRIPPRSQHYTILNIRTRHHSHATRPPTASGTIISNTDIIDAGKTFDSAIQRLPDNRKSSNILERSLMPCRLQTITKI